MEDVCAESTGSAGEELWESQFVYSQESQVVWDRSRGLVGGDDMSREEG